MKRIVMLLVIALMSCAFLLSFSQVPAQASIVINFGTGSAGSGGLISLIGLNATGSNIPLDTLNVTGAPGAGVYDLSGDGVSNDLTGSAVLNFDTVANFITITGGVPTLGISINTVLLSGSFSSFTILQPYPNVLGIYGQGTDTKDPDLLTALGINLSLPFQFFGFVITVINPLTGTGQAISTDILNTQVPEPATMLLLGSGLIGLAGFARRRLRK